MNKNPENDRRDAEYRGTLVNIYHEELGPTRDPDPDGMENWLQKVRLPPDGLGWTGEQVRQAIHDSPEAVAYRNRTPVPEPEPASPAASSLPSLAIDGMQFANPQRLCGTNQFRALRYALDGVPLDELISESKDIGFNMWRVFGMGSLQQNGMLQLSPTEPRYYDVLHQLALDLNAEGIVMLYVAYADNQDIRADNDHAVRAKDALEGTTSLISLGNEWSKNGFDPRGIPALQTSLPWSRGSDVEDALPVEPVGTFMEFHPRRNWPVILRDTVASPIDIYEKRPLIPIIIDEPARMGTDGSGDVYADPWNCWRFARHYSTETAGTVFHSRAGQRGVPMDQLTRDCAVAWRSGMRI